jgi:hypothetical protein
VLLSSWTALLCSVLWRHTRVAFKGSTRWQRLAMGPRPRSTLATHGLLAALALLAAGCAAAPLRFRRWDIAVRRIRNSCPGSRSGAFGSCIMSIMCAKPNLPSRFLGKDSAHEDITRAARGR